MERKTWFKPMTLVQKFEANETVAAAQCYGISCESTVAYGNQDLLDDIVINAPHGHRWNANDGFKSGNNGGKGIDLPISFSHNGNCRISSNNVFRVEGDNITFLLEHSSDGALKGGVDGYDKGDNGVLDSGDVVYWHTLGGAFGSIRWNHWGTLEPVDSSHPNRS